MKQTKLERRIKWAIVRYFVNESACLMNCKIEGGTITVSGPAHIENVQFFGAPGPALTLKEET